MSESSKRKRNQFEDIQETYELVKRSTEFSLLIELPPEISIFTFGEFLMPKDLYSLSLVGNYTLVNLTNDEKVWKRLVERRERRELYLTDKSEDTWKEVFRKGEWKNFELLNSWRVHYNHGDSQNILVDLGEGLFATTGLQNIKVWELKSGKLIQKIKTHDYVLCVVKYKDLIIGSIGFDNLIKAWNFSTGECVQTFEGHTDDIISICVIGDLLAGGSMIGSINLWNIETGECVKTFQNRTCSIEHMIEIGGCLIIFSEWMETKIVKWNLEDDRYEDFPDIDSSNWRTVSRSGLDENKGYFMDNEWKIGLINFSTGETEKQWKAHEKMIEDLVLTSNNQLVSFDEKYVKVWDPFQDFECILSLTNSDNDSTSLIVMKNKIVVGTKDGLVHVFGVREVF